MKSMRCILWQSKYTQHILGIREYESFDLTVAGEYWLAIGSWNTLLTPLKGTH
jgi:hypothetical protein